MKALLFWVLFGLFFYHLQGDCRAAFMLLMTFCQFLSQKLFTEEELMFKLLGWLS